jgi:transcriptional regulator with XRE-family HTH domain
MNENLSPYRDFARNLRTMTENNGSIAQVCRDLGMNRQQFNKYLSGTSLPAPVSLKKIAEYFGVDQRVMFSHADNKPGRSEFDDLKPLLTMSQIDPRLTDRLMRTLSGSVQTQFREGCHIVYYPSLSSANNMARAALVAFKVGKLMCFRRYTRFAMKGNPQERCAKGQHEGVVIEHNGRTFMLAKNVRGNGEISLQSFGASVAADFNIMTGLAMVMTPWAEPLATRVTVDYFGPKASLKKALKLCGEVSGTSPDISDTIRRSVLEPVNFPTAHLFPFQIFDNNRPQFPVL